jgi:hypothetical protein
MKIHKPNSESKERAAHGRGKKVIQDLLIRSKESITKQLQNNETPLMQFLISNLNRMLSDLQKMRRPTENQPLDQETISELLVKFHSEIGNMVRSSMMKQ